MTVIVPQFDPISVWVMFLPSCWSSRELLETVGRLMIFIKSANHFIPKNSIVMTNALRRSHSCMILLFSESKQNLGLKLAKVILRNQMRYTNLEIKIKLV